MQKIFAAFGLLLMLVSHNIGAVAETCSEKSQMCKQLSLAIIGKTPDAAACDACKLKCSDAQTTCKNSPNDLLTANTYHLGCKQACRKNSLGMIHK